MIIIRITTHFDIDNITTSEAKMDNSVAAAQDINRLVAFASSNPQFSHSGRRRAANGDFEVTTMPASGMHDKTACILLDALAAILVSKPSGEIYAVGAQMQQSNNGHTTNGFVRLYVAGNSGVPASTREFLQAMWKGLQELAQWYRQPSPHKSDMRRRSAIWPDGFHNLIRLVHHHCFLKWRKRLDQNYKLLPIMKHKLRELLGTGHGGDRIMEALDILVVGTDSFRESLSQYEEQGRDPRNVIDKSDFPSMMDKMWRAFSEISTDKWDEINKWDGLTGEQGNRFFWRVSLTRFTGDSPSQYFAKVVSFQSEIERLNRFARSPRHSLILDIPVFQIITLCEEKVKVNMPTTEQKWRGVIDRAIKPTAFHWNEAMDVCRDLKFPERERSSGLVHCECSVLQYFATHNPRPRPLSYIGSSKPPCVPCSAVFFAWNEYSTTEYSVKGSLGKWDYPWAVPTKWGEEIQGDLLEKIKESISMDIFDCMHEMGYLREAVSDSIVPSIASDEHSV